MKTLFTIAAALTGVLTLVWLAVPHLLLAEWGVQADEGTVYMSRRYGALFVGYAVLLWVARSAERSSARRAILASGAAVTGVIAIVSLIGLISGVVGPMVWSAFVIEILLAGAFTSYLVQDRSQPVSAPRVESAPQGR